MTATPATTNGWAPATAASSPLAPGALLPLQASAQVGRGQFCSFDASGNVALNDGAVPNLLSAGVAYPEYLSDSSVLAGQARSFFWWGMGQGAPASATANDGFSAADVGIPFFIKDENTPGKLSNSGGSNRSLGGIVFGVDEKGAPRIWSGPVAHLVARATLLVQTKILGHYAHPVDGAASTTTAEKTIFREPVHGVITRVRFVTLGSIAADNTDYVTINVYKADGAGGTHVLVASYDSRAANQGAITAGVPKDFALSAVAGAVNLLESDVLSYEVLKGGAGKVVPVGTLEVIGKVI